MKKIRLVLLILITLFILLSYFLYKFIFIPKGIWIDKKTYPITGIDVSKHTGKINWNKLKKQGVDFVYIKASEGINYSDPNFVINFKEVEKLMLPVGAYHFFRFNKDGESQALNYIKTTREFNLTLPPVVDVEEWGNQTNNKTTLQIKQEIRKFILFVEKHSKHSVIIYTNESSYDKFIKNHFSNNPIWICSFGESPLISDNRKWVFWQYAHNGKIDGAKEFVDLNTFNGSKTEWIQYMNFITRKGGK